MNKVKVAVIAVLLVVSASSVAFSLLRLRPPSLLVTTVEGLVNAEYGPYVSYKITSWNDTEAVVYLYLETDGQPLPFQRINFTKLDDDWWVQSLELFPSSSPAKNLVIEGYELDWAQLNGTTVLFFISPKVKNPTRLVAYVEVVEAKLQNLSNTYWIRCRTSDHAVASLIGPGENDSLWCGGLSFGFWYTNAEAVLLRKDDLARKAFNVTITLKDGKDGVVAEKSFTHYFQPSP